MRFKVFRQLESIDCGSACVQMVCAHFGREYSLSYLKSKMSLSRLGISIADIVKCCQGICLESFPVKGNSNQLAKLSSPVILYWRQSHFVVLYNVKRISGQLYFYIADPSYGKVKLNQNEFEKQWIHDGTGVAIVIRPTETFCVINQEDNNKNTYKKYSHLFAYYKNYKPKILLSFILIGLSIITNWTIPFIFQKVIDRGIIAGNMHIVYQLMLVQLIFFISYMLSSNLSSILLTKVNYKISIQFLSELLFKIIKLPIKYFDTRLNTDFIQRLEDQDRLQSFLTFRVIDVFFSFLNLIVFSVILLYYNIYIFILFFIFSFFSFIWTFYFLRERKYLDYSRFSAQAENKNNVYELINGMAEVKINNAQSKRISFWKETQEQINNIGLKALYLNYYQLIGNSFLNRLKDILITILCAYLVISGQFSLGILMSISYILGQLSGPINQLNTFSQSFQDAKISFDRLEEIQEKEDEKKENSLSVPILRDKVELRDISFKYEGNFNDYVIKNVSFVIPKGKITAIVGNSGSGKTTLLKLLLGFYYPQKGDILVDNIIFNRINIDEWRGRCGVVMQDGYIFSGTIMDNIALASVDVDVRNMKTAAQIACIDTFIESLPNKYMTKIGKSGIDLSGGQKQRILIARAIYKNPDVIMFDEATSHLDSINENIIMNNLQSFYDGKTVVIIAHRLSTVVHADNIIFLDKGRILEQGVHQELWEKKGHYYELVRNQLEIEI